MKSNILTERELRRFAEQMKLPSVGINGQEKLKNSRALVVGAGGKGTALLQCLATAGIGTIGISDNYGIEEADLPRQSIYGDHDIGRQKAITAKQKLSQINQSVHFELHNICLSEDNILQIFSDYDLIADATDNFSTHYLINDAAVMKGKPVVFGSVFHNQGMVTVFNHDNGPSFRCLFPKTPHHSAVPDDKAIFGLSVLYHLTGTLMSNEVLAILLGQPVSLSGKLLLLDISDYSIRKKNLTKNPENFHLKGFIH